MTQLAAFPTAPNPAVTLQRNKACTRDSEVEARSSHVVHARRAMGQITKQIAAAEGISERTVREHLQQIKKKLYTDDIVNAVVIAIKSGMLRCPWEKGMSEH